MKPSTKMKITHFPDDVRGSISTARGYRTLPYPDQHRELALTFALLQQQDYVDGLDFAESTFLTKDIKALTPEWLEWFVKSLHFIVARTLCALNSNGHPAGIYTRDHVMLTREAAPGESYDPLDINDPYSLRNYNLLAKKYGHTDADHYQSFCTALLAKRNALPHMATPMTLAAKYQIGKNSLAIILSSETLHEHPGYQVVSRMVRIGSAPEKKPGEMKAFFNKLHKLIQQDAPSAKIAGLVLELGNLRPFTIGNGIVARILMNCCLMSFGVPPLVIHGPSKQTYNQAFESEDPNSLEKYVDVELQAQSSRELGKYQKQFFIPTDRETGICIVDLKSKHIKLPFADGAEVSEWIKNPNRAADGKHQRIYTKDTYVKIAATHSEDPFIALFYLHLAVRCAESTVMARDLKKKSLFEVYASIAEYCIKTEGYDFAMMYACRALQYAKGVTAADDLQYITTKKLVESLSFLKSEHDLSSEIVAASQTKPQAEHQFYAQQGELALNAGNTGKAIVFYKMALKLTREDHSVWYNKGRAHFKLQQFPEARECFEQVLRLAPNHAQGTDCLERVLEKLYPNAGTVESKTPKK